MASQLSCRPIGQINMSLSDCLVIEVRSVQMKDVPMIENNLTKHVIRVKTKDKGWENNKIFANNLPSKYAVVSKKPDFNFIGLVGLSLILFFHEKNFDRIFSLKDAKSSIDGESEKLPF